MGRSEFLRKRCWNLQRLSKRIQGHLKRLPSVDPTEQASLKETLAELLKLAHKETLKKELSRLEDGEEEL